ncbi:MAG TPA: hypothetical protein VFB73_05195 [Chloroflexota bacterium]|nr:hypothetical protein [Chloroflexota bacterium]HZU05346.1 hypothetical protein [Chloroflexota bacterium]
MNPAGTRLFVSSCKTDNVSVLDATTDPPTVLTTVALPGAGCPTGIAAR